MNNSINLLVEKPLCLSVHDHLNLNKIAKKNNVKIFVDYPFIFSGSIRYIKNIYNRKKYGKLLAIESFREQAEAFQAELSKNFSITVPIIQVCSDLIKSIKPMQKIM